MAEVSFKLPLPRWLINLCCWFWTKQRRMWSLLGSIIFTVALGLGISLSVTNTTNFKGTYLAGATENLAQNWPVYTLILLIVFLLLLFFTLFSFIVYSVSKAIASQSPVGTDLSSSPIGDPTTPENAKSEQVPVQIEQIQRDPRQSYLRYLQQQVNLLPPLGLGVSDLISPQAVRLADVFIPLEFRESPKALKLQPLNQDEISIVSGLDRQHKYYLLIDSKGEWERTFMTRDRMDIATLWQSLSPERPAAVIQGAPGSGKSTLLSRITLSMVRQELGEPETQLALMPVLVSVLVLIKEYADYLDKLPTAVAGASDEEPEKRSLLTFII